jgi:hypothetical protein
MLQQEKKQSRRRRRRRRRRRATEEQTPGKVLPKVIRPARTSTWLDESLSEAVPSTT